MDFKKFFSRSRQVRSCLLVLVILSSAFLAAGCATFWGEPKTEIARSSLLRVAVCPYYPPVIFKQGDEIKGVDADFARRVASLIGRRVEFVEVGRDQLIPALMRGDADIVMSGMTITDARKTRASFSEPYLKVGLVTLLRAEDSAKFDSLPKIRETGGIVAVVKGTTSETFVRNNFRNATNIIALQAAKEAPILLTNRRIDLFVHDSPSIAWLVSENEGVLKGFWEPFNVEYLGWALNPQDKAFLTRIDSTLETWKKDGTLKEVITKWLPYWKE